MKTMFDQPFIAISQHSLLQSQLFCRGITDVRPPTECLAQFRYGLFLAKDGSHLVTNGDDLVFRAFGAATTPSNVSGLALLLSFKGISQQPFHIMGFQNSFSRLD